MFSIRPEAPEDAPSIRRLNEAAFGQPDEADLVDKLRRDCPDLLSLVADEEGRIVGHILFSPAVVEGAGGVVVAGVGLAPMAVVPTRQRRGIGTALVERGLTVLRGRRCPFVVVLGHPDYYPRFGFAPAARHGIACPWEGVPEEAFMALVLDPDAMDGVVGTARYRPEFDAAI